MAVQCVNTTVSADMEGCHGRQGPLFGNALSVPEQNAVLFKLSMQHGTTTSADGGEDLHGGVDDDASTVSHVR